MSESPIISLSPEAKTVLRAVLDRKLVRGGELLRYESFKTPQDLVEPIKQLLEYRLIDASGLGAELTADTVLFATFTTPPSRERRLRELTAW